MMLHRIFTTQQLSKLFKIATTINIVCFFALFIQSHYLENYTILYQIIDSISHVCFYIIATIIISQIIIIITKNHQEFIHKYKLIGITIELFLTFFLLSLLDITHHIEKSFIVFYSSASLHDTQIMYVLIFILIMLFINLYHSIQDNKKITAPSIIKILWEEFHLFVIEYSIIICSLIGLLNIESLHKFAISSVNYTKTTLFFYGDIFGYAIITIWIIAISYYFYYKKYQKNSNKLHK
jgi:hypothetical protein